MTRDVIVIGGSAGALSPLIELLGVLGARDDVAVVVVLHLSGSHPSLLPQTLAQAVPQPVREASDKQPLARGVVTVAPGGYHLLMEADRTLAVSCDAPVNFSRPSIDVLFEATADAVGAAAIGVVLSGASPDGARGLAAIRRAGGVALVQDPDTASSPAMPRAAIELASPALVATPAALGAWLVAHLGGAT